VTAKGFTHESFVVTRRGKRHSVEHEIPFTSQAERVIYKAGNALLGVTEKTLNRFDTFGQPMLGFLICQLQLFFRTFPRLVARTVYRQAWTNGRVTNRGLIFSGCISGLQTGPGNHETSQAQQQKRNDPT
jgi:hypothetical protein